MIKALLFALFDFDKLFEFNSDASWIGLKGVLIQNGQPNAFFSEILSSSNKNYSTYDLEFYVIVQALKHCKITFYKRSLF
jgi:hypothetical protein